MVLPVPAAEEPNVTLADEALQKLVASTYKTSHLEFFLNGTRVKLQTPNPHWTLLDFIRSQHGLKGTKLGCGEGGCGACTVVLQVADAKQKGIIRHLAVNACLYPLVGVVGKHVITVEGLGSVNNPHPLQERLAKLHGSQCGFCTPGIVMSTYAMIRNAYDQQSGKLKLSRHDVELKGYLDGNLCRCTGYKPILEAINTFVTQDLQGEILPNACVADTSGQTNNEKIPYELSSLPNAANASSTGSCGRPGGCCKDDPAKESCSSTPSSDAGDSEDTSLTSVSDEDTTESTRHKRGVPQIKFLQYAPDTELIYPPSLHKFEHRAICYGDETKIWLRPTRLQELLELLDVYPDAKLVGGASEVQIEVRLKASSYPVSVFIADIAELAEVSVPKDVATMKELVIGGNTLLSNLETICIDLEARLKERGSVFGAMAKVLRYFAGLQIRNAASLAGNIATASPISDMNPVLIAADATIVTQTLNTKTVIPMKSMFKGYRKTALPQGSVITRIHIPIPPAGIKEVTKSYKQARRKEDDIAIVTAGFRVRISYDGTVEETSLVYGGMAPMTVEATECSDSLTGKPWKSQKTLQYALTLLARTFPLPYGVPGGMASYRRTLALSMFFRFWHESVAELGLGKFDSGLEEIERGLSFGSRDNYNPNEQKIVGKQIPHLSGLKHATGEAEYLDDMPHQDRELYCALVISQKAHALLKSVDWTPALRPGLAIGYIDKHNIDPDKNNWGSIIKNEPWFATDKVTSHGQPIGVVYAETALKAQEAARAVKVEYEELKPILSVDEAIEVKSFYDFYKKDLRKGAPPEELDQVFAKCDYVFEGTSRAGGQEHFYLETNTSMVIPHVEDNSMEVWSSTQHTLETQEMISYATGIPSNRINTRVKRMGGAFGGKESRSVQIAGLLAIAALKERRPMRIMLSRDEDMAVSGQRHPIRCDWKIGVTKTGKLVALQADCYSNAGWSLDMSSAVMDRCITHLDNCYEIPNVYIKGWLCKTNTHSNTAFRGFGGPQSMYFTETIMYDVAERLKIDVDELRLRNLYNEGNLTPYLQKIDEDWHIPLLLEQLKKEADYEARKAKVEEFNSKNKWRKRGICLVPTKFGLSFSAAHLNQGAASVKIYTDGSVLLNHGGTEMGQGLYTKMCQVAAQELKIPIDNIYTADTSSYQIPNASPTAASSGSDLNGMAIKDACDQLNERLQPYRERLGPNASFKEITRAAYMDRVNLAATGHWKMPRIGYVFGVYDPELVKPLYYYFTQGAACTEVELDLLTGDHSVLRTDIKLDVGRSINPAIDYGQIEGAFVQGQGMFTIEQSLWTNDGTGQLFTRGPGTYKIPGFGDIPREFNVTMLQGVSWESIRTIQSSKGIGEPPVFLGSTVLFALRDALRSARADNNVFEPLRLDSPATAERLRLAVCDDLVEMAKVQPGPGEKPFFLTAV
ncbi:uncharacterized protein TRUGW13939_07238 [Talaromyces rugulosus]|uniref:xanthine dehydrogenase n=1 Tax=Talaromyces rugulosus TaxID=121627 RepID=A0A7H8R204_TALRU|nr:uncharacterized protein TRUGW13939_07238 [Talaromyces rugulosus]QKX60096.1 hypothetical protein TRUGW13939_07238 [Talaromyces rugulosus]